MSKEFNQRLKQRLVMLLIALPIAIITAKFIPNPTYNWLYNCFVAVCVVFALYYIIQISRINSRLDQSRAHAEQWKRRIRSIADSTESPDNDLTFDEFCEFEGDKVLAEVVEELEKMPSGKRHLKKAYEIVSRKSPKTGN